MDLMQSFNEKYLKAEPPKVEVGSTVRVHIKVKEGNRERIQALKALAQSNPDLLMQIVKSIQSANTD